MTEKNQKTEDRPLQSSRVILCEGADEYDIFIWLRENQNLTEFDVEIVDAKGRTNLVSRLGDLPYESGGSNVTLVCVVLDAEERTGNDKKLLKDLENKANEVKLKILCIELPDTQNSGALETLVHTAADNNSKPYQCADAWAKCIDEDSGLKTQAQKDKAWTHVWMAGYGDFYSRLGYAFKSSDSVRQRLLPVQQRFEKILNQVLQHPLNNPA